MQNKQTKSVFASNTLALITEYMVLASGGSKTGGFAFELIYETGLHLSISSIACKHKDNSHFGKSVNLEEF